MGIVRQVDDLTLIEEETFFIIDSEINEAEQMKSKIQEAKNKNK